MIKTYRKTATIKAEQFDGSNKMVDKYRIEYDEAYMVPFRIEALEGWIGIDVGDWIATGVHGEHWLIADAVFKQTYAELPVIPENVAEYINYMKLSGRDIWDAMHYPFRSNDISEYMEDNSEMFARAWLDGYQVEESYEN
ncbi:DUF1642 domain-containing protein [Lactiplantibacillus plantarum]|uniref:DUF1642 domain-containing protein n=1 Tax=Lactiplantibacillus plantarum TaxID=1590 RepID=UPI00338D9781